jgi:hypothetical protein
MVLKTPPIKTMMIMRKKTISLTFDTRPGRGRAGGLPRTEWPPPVDWRRLSVWGPQSSCWWWRRWSWSSTVCPRPGGMPGPPQSPHLQQTDNQSDGWNSEPHTDEIVDL